jgi:iron complex transport system ATP-binding protein
MPEDSTLLAADGLEVRVGGRPLCAALRLEIRPGQSWALLGPNGAGKTTLLHTLAGLRAPADGRLRLFGRELAAWQPRRLACRLGVLFQHVEAGFPARVLETVLTGRHPHLGRWGWEGAADLALARRALAEVGLAGTEQRFLDTLSGGERQRVALAALLTQDPEFALLDEPGSHLDVGRQIQLLELLRSRFTAQGRAQLMVLHDPTLALRCCDHVLLLFGDGRWVAGPAKAVATTEVLSELYGHPLLRFDGPHGPVFAPA